MKCEILDSLYKDDIDLNMFEVDENQGFKDNIVEYICGFVVKKSNKKQIVKAALSHFLETGKMA